MSELPKIPVGLGTITGVALTVLAVVGGVVLLLAGKTPAEKEAGQQLLAVAAPVVGAVTVGGRLAQGAAQQGAGATVSDVPTPLSVLAAEAAANVAKVQASPDGTQSGALPFSGAPEQTAAPVQPPQAV